MQIQLTRESLRPGGAGREPTKMHWYLKYAVSIGHSKRFLLQWTKSNQMLRVGSWELHASVKRNKLKYVGSFRIFFNKKSCRSEKMLDLTYLLLLIWLIHHVFHNVNIYEASFLIHFLYIILIIQWQWYVKIPIESIMKIILQQLPWRHFRV